MINNGRVYPPPHPKADEIKKLKVQINEWHIEMQKQRIAAREAYKTAGECTATISTLMEDIADALKRLEAIAEEPLI